MNYYVVYDTKSGRMLAEGNARECQVIKKYTPPTCEEQTMIETSDGRLFHAPTRDFLKLGYGGLRYVIEYRLRKL